MSIGLIGRAARPALGLVAVVLVGALVGCGGGGSEIDFSRHEAAGAGAGSASSPPSDLLRMAVAPVLSPAATSDLYEDLSDYLGEKMGRPVELVQGKTYGEINDLVKSGDVTLALVCTNPYLEGREEFGMELVVAPQVDGDTVYYSLLIVGSGMEAESLADLRGATFAFTDPLSNTGRLAPLYQLAQMGESPDSFFSRTIFTYAHDSSIQAVADGVVMAAAVDSVVYEYVRETQPSLIAKVEVVERWGPFGIYPFVVNPRLDPQLKADLRQVFLEMDEESEGRAILRHLKVDRFAVPDDSIYDSVREMRAYLREHVLAP
jgi:phosphonate transport system substrate-binding protein